MKKLGKVDARNFFCFLSGLFYQAILTNLIMEKFLQRAIEKRQIKKSSKQPD